MKYRVFYILVANAALDLNYSSVSIYVRIPTFDSHPMEKNREDCKSTTCRNKLMD
jgi:hypothetical protein